MKKFRELIEAKELIALKKMIDIAKNTLTGNLQGIYGKGAKYDLIKGGGASAYNRWIEAVQKGKTGPELDMIMMGLGEDWHEKSGGRMQENIKGAKNLIDAITSPEYAGTFDIAGFKTDKINSLGEQVKGGYFMPGLGNKWASWKGTNLYSGKEYGMEGERGLDKGLLTSIRGWQKDIAEIVSEYFGKELIWDTTKPMGDMKRLMDMSRAKSYGFESKISFEDGIQKTIEWYKENK